MLIKTLHGRKQVLICTSILHTVIKIITDKNDHFSSVVYGRNVTVSSREATTMPCVPTASSCVTTVDHFFMVF